MAWTDPKQFVEGEILTARDLNVYLRDNMLENEVMKAQTAGSRLTTGTDGGLIERTFGYDSVSTSESRISNSMVQTGAHSFFYTNGPMNLGVPGPTVTVTTGTKALVFYSSVIKTDILAERDGWDSSAAVGVDCTTSSLYRLASYDEDNEPRNNMTFYSITKGSAPNVTTTCFFSNLTPGPNTFVMRYFLGSPEPIYDLHDGSPTFGQLIGWSSVTTTFANRQLLVIPI